ncbi:MAG: DoxX family protein [Verrucomicrobiota bacterium]
MKNAAPLEVKVNNIVYRISTVILTIFLVGGAFTYLSGSERIQVAFSNEMTDGYNAIGFPAWLIIPMAIMKLAGALAIWIPLVPKWLREWAYAGIFFNMFLAIGAHVFNPINPEDSDLIAILPFVMVIVSRVTLAAKERSLTKSEV